VKATTTTDALREITHELMDGLVTLFRDLR
jgi:hypothetical protein